VLRKTTLGLRENSSIRFPHNSTFLFSSKNDRHCGYSDLSIWKILSEKKE
jgi:hypothetical protein